MQFREVPKTGDRLSALGFGCMRLPQKGGKIDEERAAAQIRFAVDRGVNYIDTAMPYHLGASEPFLGKALAGGFRERVRLATKLPHWQVREKRDMERLFSAQLLNLQTQVIDYYLLHNINASSWARLQELGVMEFLRGLKESGRISYTGFSFHSRFDEFRDIIDSFDWDFCQIQYNYLDRENQAGTRGLEYAAARGLGVIIMEPLRGGYLGGPVPPAIDAIWNEAPVKRSPAEWALRWIWDRPEVTVILSGMNDENHIEENVRIAADAGPNSLSREELLLVDRVERKFRELMKVGCTGCRYCMPCPSGVDIPACFEVYNNRYLWGKRNDTFIVYLAMTGNIMGAGSPSYASLCTECGKCEKECPQGIPIRRHLKDTAAEFEGFRFTMMRWIARNIFSLQRRRSLRRGGKKRHPVK